MQYDEIMKATLLLCCHFNKNEVKDFKPLSGLEYHRLAQWLYQHEWTPADLLSQGDEILGKWFEPIGKITAERIVALLSRGGSLALALEKWSQQNIWVISRGSPVYPQAFRTHLPDKRPPVLFGLGNQDLLNLPGIGIVGSRSIEKDDEDFAVVKARQAVDDGYLVISGGAKGVDMTAMKAALAHGGQCVGIVADGLYCCDARRVLIDYLRQKKLVLISPYFPEAGFSTGNAMGRNKLIYTMSQAVVVVKSDKNEGGTWAGATENLTKKWVPLFVRNVPHEGNQALLQMGARKLGADSSSFKELIEAGSAEVAPEASVKGKETSQTDTLMAPCLPLLDASPEKAVDVPELANLIDMPESEKTIEEPGPEKVIDTSESVCQPESINKVSLLVRGGGSLQGDFFAESIKPQEADLLKQRMLDIQPQYGPIFELFVNVLVALLKDKNDFITVNDIKNSFPELEDMQIKKWLKELEEGQCLLKDGRRLRYKLV